MILQEQIMVLRQDTQAYPVSLLTELALDAPTEIWAAGPAKLLAQPKTGFFCSSQCPGSIILKTFDAITRMRDEGEILIGGFHSVMEWECLSILLRGHQPVIWVPARSIVGMRLKPELEPAFKDGRLLILSPFATQHKRVTASLAKERNRFTAVLADQIFVAHAALGSRTMDHCIEFSRQNRPILTIDDTQNRSLLQLPGVEKYSTTKHSS